jgi:hypothetical protein
MATAIRSRSGLTGLIEPNHDRFLEQFKRKRLRRTQLIQRHHRIPKITENRLLCDEHRTGATGKTVNFKGEQDDNRRSPSYQQHSKSCSYY